MNLILFESDELNRPLPRTDRRAVHLVQILRRQAGDTFDAGVIDGPRGKGTLVELTDASLTLSFSWGPPPPPAEPITLLIGLPRPQTARDILRDATALGVGAIHFVRTEKSEPSYAQSRLWSSGEWRRHALAGAEQAFATRIPVVTHGRSLAETLTSIPRDTQRVALDNYESAAPLGSLHAMCDSAQVLAIGSERGWSAEERTTLRVQGFALFHLGPRVLRTETAVTAALAIVRSKLGRM